MVSRKLEELVRKESMPLAVVNDEYPLIEGLADRLKNDGYSVASIDFDLEVSIVLGAEGYWIPNKFMDVYGSKETFLFIPNYSIQRKRQKFAEIFQALQKSLYRPMIEPTSPDYGFLSQKIDFIRALRIYSWDANYLNQIRNPTDPNSPYAEIRSHFLIVQNLLNSPTFAFEGVNMRELQEGLIQAYDVLEDNGIAAKNREAKVISNVKFGIEAMHRILYRTELRQQVLH